MTFDKFHSRQDEGSIKWTLMKNAHPQVSEGVIPMTVADMEFKTCPQIVDGLKAYIESAILGYTIPNDTYTGAIIDHYKSEYDVTIDKKDIVTSSGVVTSLFDCINAFTKQGDGVVVMTPVYPQFYRAINDTNRTVIKSGLLFEGDKYQIDFEDLEEKLKEVSNVMLILCNPHNPSGRVWSRQDIERIKMLCRDNDVYLVADEIHGDLTMFGNKLTSIFAFDSSYDDFNKKEIVLSSASKSFNLAGLKCSNVIIRDRDLRKEFLAYIATTSSFGANMVGLKATELAYTEGIGWLRDVIKYIEGNLNYIKDFFESYVGLFKVYDIQATYLAWINFKSFADKHNMSHEDFMNLLNKAEFFVNPGHDFGEEGNFHFRVNVAMPRHKLAEALDRLKIVLDNMKK